MLLFPFGMMLAAGWTVPGLAQDCPPAGSRFEHDNGVVRSIVTSLGGRRNASLGCQWRRSIDDRVIWLEPGVSMKPAGANAVVTPRPVTTRAPVVVRSAPPRAQAPARPAPPIAAPAQQAGPIRMGVYECDQPIDVGGMMMGSPMTGPMFGVTGPGAYRDFDGGTGGFSFDGSVLTMTSGPLRGTRYRREGPTLFKPLNAKGETGPIRCILNRNKSLRGRW